MTEKKIRNTGGLKAHAEEKRKRCLEKVDAALQSLSLSKKRINFNTVSAEADVSKAYLYNMPSIKKRIIALREQQRDTPPERKKHNMTESSKDVLIAAKNRRIDSGVDTGKQPVKAGNITITGQEI